MCMKTSFNSGDASRMEDVVKWDACTGRGKGRKGKEAKTNNVQWLKPIRVQLVHWRVF